MLYCGGTLIKVIKGGITMKTNLHKMFAVDTKSAEEGKWFPIAPGVEFKIRRMNSVAANNIRRNLLSVYPNGMVPPDQTEEFAVKFLAHAIVVDWKGVTDENGKEIPYSPETAHELLKEIPEIAEKVAEITQNLDNFRPMENAEKN